MLFTTDTIRKPKGRWSAFCSGCVDDMVHRFGLNCLCREESLEDQCDRLFNVEAERINAIVALSNAVWSSGRHWCDGYIYETVLGLSVDVLPSKEAVITKIPGFVRECDADAIGSAVLKMEEEWASILGPDFNLACILSDVAVFDSKDEEQNDALELRNKRENFMTKAWEVYRVAVINDNFEPF